MLTDQELQSLRNLGGLSEDAADEIAALRAQLHSVQQHRGRFAGWFIELPSGMTYRLWEQGGADPRPGDVALYE